MKGNSDLPYIAMQPNPTSMVSVLTGELSAFIMKQLIS